MPAALARERVQEPDRIGRRALPEAPAGPSAQVVGALLPLLEQKTDRRFLDAMARQHAEAREKVVDAYTRRVERMQPIHPEYVAAQLDDLADDHRATAPAAGQGGGRSTTPRWAWWS